MKQILFSLLLLAVQTSAADEINQTQLFSAEQQANKLSYNLLIKDIEALKKQLKDLVYPQEKIIVKSRVLTLLSQQQPSDEQKAWVVAQVNSSENLKLLNSDHPKHVIEVVNIARQAKNTLFQWQINKKQDNYYQQWLNQNWHWELFISSATELEYKAFSQAIVTTDELTIDWLQQQLIGEGLTQANNRLLALLTSRKSNLILLNQLWKNPSDQYSYQVLQQIKEILSSEQAIEQLVLASENDKLISQSLFLLATNFQYDEQAQKFLLTKLQQPSSAWYAAAALSQTTNAELQQALKLLSSQSNKAAIKFAAKHLTSKLPAEEQ